MIKNIPMLFNVILLLLVTTHSHAEIYKWIDESGKTHFTDKPPAGQATEEIELKINTYSTVNITPLIERLGKESKVVIYSADWCGICTRAKKHFIDNNIDYISYDVEKSRVGKMDFKLLKGKSVPIIIVGKKRMNGFSIPKFEKLYKQEINAKLTN